MGAEVCEELDVGGEEDAGAGGEAQTGQVKYCTVESNMCEVLKVHTRPGEAGEGEGGRGGRRQHRQHKQQSAQSPPTHFVKR